MGAGNQQFSSDGSDIGDVDAEVVSPMITLSLTDGCDGDPVGVIAVKGVWCVALGPSGAEALSWTGDDDGAPGVALSFQLGGDGIDPAPVPRSTFASSNSGKRLEFDERLGIGDSGFVCFDVVGRLMVSPYGASDWVPWEMAVCAI